ncbi:hypothetical protein NB689_001655 [Xanthomonas sacchari]|nr:hypothetical protein [Xanthomonas sacchari]
MSGTTPMSPSGSTAPTWAPAWSTTGYATTHRRCRPTRRRRHRCCTSWSCANTPSPAGCAANWASGSTTTAWTMPRRCAMPSARSLAKARSNIRASATRRTTAMRWATAGAGCWASTTATSWPCSNARARNWPRASPAAMPRWRRCARAATAREANDWPGTLWPTWAGTKSMWPRHYSAWTISPRPCASCARATPTCAPLARRSNARGAMSNRPSGPMRMYARSARSWKASANAWKRPGPAAPMPARAHSRPCKSAACPSACRAWAS